MTHLVLTPPFTSLPTPGTSYEAEALAFCRRWLAGETAFSLPTSGSTGTPKTISLSRAQMSASAHLTGQTFGLRAGHHALVCLNIRYVAGVMMLVRGLELGLKLTVIDPSANPLAGFRHPDDRFDFAAFVPLQMQTMLETPGQTLPLLNGMKAMLVGGAAVEPSLEKRLQIIQAPVFSTYGMTETVSHVAVRRINGPERTDVFTALEGVTLGTDERSCLHVTAAATDFRTVQTNDMVELLDEKRFWLLGRADSVINSGGVKVQPEKVEKAVGEWLAEQHLSIRQFVAGLPDLRLGQQVTLFLEADAWDAETTEALKNYLRRRLSAFECPRRLIFASSFRQTPTGKIDRRATVDAFS